MNKVELSFIRATKLYLCAQSALVAVLSSKISSLLSGKIILMLSLLLVSILFMCVAVCCLTKQKWEIAEAGDRKRSLLFYIIPMNISKKPYTSAICYRGKIVRKVHCDTSVSTRRNTNVR